jgi:ribosomal protein L24
MEYLVLHKSVKIIRGDDIGRDGHVVRITQDNDKIFVVVKFNHREYGIYKISDVEITVCC